MKNKSEDRRINEERTEAEEDEERSDEKDDTDKDKEDADDDEDDDEEEDREPVKRRRGKQSKDEQSARDARPVAATQGATLTMSRALMLAAVMLFAGVAVGWGLRDARAEEGTAGKEGVAEGKAPCDTWKDEICKGTSSDSAACSNAKASSGMLPATACNAALADMPATLERIKAARASCDKLVTKLCTDLGKESSGCQLVTAKTPGIPPEGCDEMLENYSQVLAQLQMMGQRPPGMPGMMGPGGPPPGGPPAGGPPPDMHGGPAHPPH